MYRGVHRNSTVLFKSVVASNQIQRVIVDNKFPFAVYEDDTTNTIMVGGEDEDGTKLINVYYYNPEQDAIYMRVDSVDATGDNVSIDTGDSVPFCFNVQSVNYDPQFYPETGQAYALKLSLLIHKFGLDYNRNETISLRNRPTLVSGASEAETEQLLAEKLGA